MVPAGLAQLGTAAPQDVHIRVESFRYGKQPSVIRCNRGDRLHLELTARDTAHSFFLEEFDLDAKVSPHAVGATVFRVSDPGAPPDHREEVVFTADHPGWLGPLISKSQYRCHVWCGPLHAFEQGYLIIEPNTLLYAGLGLLFGIFAAGLLGMILDGSRPAGHGSSPRARLDLLGRFPSIKRLVKRRWFQTLFVMAATVLLYVIVLTCLFGTHVAGRNLGTMLVWVVWLFALLAILTPLGGRSWCLMCPLPFLGESLQRLAITGVRSGNTAGTNNRLFGLSRQWPAWLDNAWLRIVSLMVLGTFSTTLVASPATTGWVVLGMAVAAALMALVWKGRSFCMYLCPIHAFVGLYSTAGKLGVRSADPATCEACELRTCQRGSKNGWACPYGLCVAEIKSNTDCGLCTECVKTCAYDNVALEVLPLSEKPQVRSLSEVWLAAALLVVAAAYCVVHLGPWPRLRDAVDLLDKGNWAWFGIYAVALWGASLVALPAILIAVIGVGKKVGRITRPLSATLVETSGCLLPLGLMAWIAFAIPLVTVNLSFVAQSLSDPFGWGWDFFGTAGTPWHQLWPSAIPWIQVGCIGLGLAASLRAARRAWFGLTDSPHLALWAGLPISFFLVAIASWFVVFFAD